MSAAALAGVALVAAGAATVQLIAGFGFALAAVPLFSVVIDPHDAIIVSLGIATVTSGAQAWAGRRQLDRGVARGMLAGAAAGLPVGWLVYLWADNQVLGIVIGIAVLASVVVISRGLDLRHTGPGLDVAGGVLSGSVDDVVERERPAVGVRPPGAPVRGGPVPQHDHDGVRGARRDRTDHLRGDGRDRRR